MVERRSAPESERLPLVPLYKQYDPRWKDISFDDPKWDGKFEATTIASAGCGPSVLAMGLSYYKGREIFPPEIAKKIVDNGWRAVSWDETAQKWEPDGTARAAMVGIPQLYDVKSVTAPWDEAKKALLEGKLVIQSQGPGNIGPDGKRDGHFTSFGHYILLTGIEGERYKVHDSGPRNITHATEEKITKDLNQSWILG